MLAMVAGFTLLVYRMRAVVFRDHNTVSGFCADPSSFSNRFLLSFCWATSMTLSFTLMDQLSISWWTIADNRFWIQLGASLLFVLVGIFPTDGGGRFTHLEWGVLRIPIAFSTALHVLGAVPYIFVLPWVNFSYSLDSIERSISERAAKIMLSNYTCYFTENVMDSTISSYDWFFYVGCLANMTTTGFFLMVQMYIHIQLKLAEWRSLDALPMEAMETEIRKEKEPLEKGQGKVDMEELRTLTISFTDDRGSKVNGPSASFFSTPSKVGAKVFRAFSGPIHPEAVKVVRETRGKYNNLHMVSFVSEMASVFLVTCLTFLLAFTRSPKYLYNPDILLP